MTQDPAEDDEAVALDDGHRAAGAQPFSERAGGGTVAFAHVGGEHEHPRAALRAGRRHAAMFDLEP